MSSLQENLLTSQKSIENLLQLIPVRFYVQDDDEQQFMSSKFMKNKKQYKLEQKKLIKQLAREAKKSKLDPDNVQNVDDLKRKKKEEALNNEMQEEDDSTVDNQDLMKMDPKVEMNGTVEQEIEIKPMKSSSIHELKERVQARIAELKAKRNGIDPNQVDLSSLPRSKQEILEKRLKKKEEKIKSKRDQQSKGNMNKKRPLEETADQNDKLSSSNKVGADGDNNMKRQKKEVQEDVAFGRIEFGDDQGDEKKKKGPTDTLGKLKKAEKEKAKLEELQKKNPDKAAQVTESIHWSKIMSRAQGEKIKDDPSLLKKTLKREQKQKEKSKKSWDDRQSAVNKAQEDRQKRRTENIQARKEGKPTKKNTNKRRPGFEGGQKKKKITNKK